jgi:transposase
MSDQISTSTGQGTYPGHADDESNHRQRPAALREQLYRVAGKMEPVRLLVTLRPGPITSTTASAKINLRAIARRRLALDEEIKGHDDAHLDTLTATLAPEIVQARVIGTGTAAEMLM